jgi:hypothetical protein
MITKTTKTDTNTQIESTNLVKSTKNTHIKTLQLLIVLVLLVFSFYAGKTSMSKQIYGLNDRIDQLEIQMNELQQ